MTEAATEATSVTRGMCHYMRGPCRQCGAECDQMGVFMANPFPKESTLLGGGFHCPTCIALEESRLEEDARQQRVTDLVASGLLRSRKTTRECFANSKADYEDTEVYEKARKWRPASNNVILHGKVGTGKTYLGHCLLMKCVEAGMRAAEIDAVTFNEHADCRQCYKTSEPP